jgi:hypothetical protein
VFELYVADGLSESDPAPVTDTVHDSRAEPVYVTLEGQLTAVAETATLIVNDAVPVEPSWFESPAYV